MANFQVQSPATISVHPRHYVASLNWLRLIIGCLASCLHWFPAISQGIVIGNVPQGCLGGSVPISFTATGPFGPGNQFKVAFHDAGGRIAEVTENVTSSGGVVRIPPNLRPSLNYKIIVVSTNPVVASFFVDFRVNTPPTGRLLPPTAEAILNPGETLPLSVRLTGGGPYSLQFTDGQLRNVDDLEVATVTMFPPESRTYQLATVSNQCGVAGGSGSVAVTVKGAGLLVTRLSTTEPCAGQPLLIHYSTDRPLAANTPFRVDFIPVEGTGPTYSTAATANGSPLRITVPANLAASGAYRLRLSSDALNLSAYYRDQYDPVASPILLRRSPNVRLTGNTTINFGQTAQLAATITGFGTGMVGFSDGTDAPFTAYEPASDQPIAVQPTQTTTYTVQRVSSGCTQSGAEAGSGSATVTVRPGYRIDSLSSTSVCTGQSFQVFFTTNEGTISTNVAEYSLRGAAGYVGNQLQAGLIDFVVQRVEAGARPNTGVLTATARALPADYLTNATFSPNGTLGAGQFYCQMARNGNAGNVFGRPLAVATPPQLILREAVTTLDRPQLTYLLADLVSQASPVEITLSDGSRQRVSGNIDQGQKASIVPIEALATQATNTFNVASVQNVCGVGSARGSATVRVRNTDTTAIFVRPIPAVLCGTAPVSVAFVTVGTFPANTTYRVEIMENDGLFKGRYLASGSASPLNVVIPVGYTLFNQVQLRVVASNPASGTAVRVSAARAATYLDPSQIVKLTHSLAATEVVIRPGEAAPLRLAGGGGNTNTPVDVLLSTGQAAQFAGVATDVLVRPTQTTTYTLRSVRNVCGAATGTGTVTVRVQPFYWQPQLPQAYFCEGDSLGITVVQQGVVPGGATHALQLIRNENVVQTLPAQLTGNRLTASLPTSLSVGVGYQVRVLSAVGQEQFYSQLSSSAFRVYRVPRLQLTPPNNQSAVVLESDQNSVNVQLTNPTNANALLTRPYRYRINDQFYNTLDNLPTTVPLFANNARPTSYSVSAVYDAYCGFGTATGSVRISYKPGLRSLSLNKTQFCRNGEQASLNYEISGDFEPSARFTAFLTSPTGTRIRVAESANPIDRLSFPISNTLSPGTYLVTLVSSVSGIPGLDNPLSIVVGDVPTVVIAGGNAALYANEALTVGVRVTGGFLPVSVTFTNGVVQTLNATENTLTFVPQQSVAYQVAQATNSCGVGRASGTAWVTVLPGGANELRVTTIAPTGSVQGICQGGTVNVTIDARGTFGGGNTYTVYLSDTTGLNYRPLPTRAVSTNVLSATLPAEAIGAGYRLRIGASNPAVLGASSTFLTIRPGLVATIAGPTQASVNELVPILITLNNPGPAVLTLTNSRYGLEQLIINESPFFYRVRLDATTTYTLQSVTSQQCGTGRATGSLTITILNVLATDPNVPVTATVWPNPTSGRVRMSGTLPSPQRVTLRLTDVQGRTLGTYDLGPTSMLTHDLNLSGYASGTYLLSVETDGGRSVFKVVRQ